MANTLTSLMKIVKSGTAGRIGGTIVDTFTAGRILAKYKGLTTDVSKRKFASLSVKEMSDFKVTVPKVAAPLDNSRDAFKQDTSFYVEYDDENEGFGVFGDSTGFCYLLASNKDEAEAKSDSLNKQKKSGKTKSAKSKRIAASSSEMVENFCFEIEELVGGNTIHEKDPLAVEAKDALEDLNQAVFMAVKRYRDTVEGIFNKKNDADAEYDQGLRDMRED